MLPGWGWKEWAIGVLLIILFVAMEGAYRAWERQHRQVVDLGEQVRQLRKPALLDERRRNVQCLLARLSASEKEALRRTVVVGQMVPDEGARYLGEHGFVSSLDILEKIVEKTQFLRRTFIGYYEVNPVFKDILEELLSSGA